MTIGHNGALASYIERIERLEKEKDDLATDIREVYAEAKSNGFDPKIMRAVVRERKLSEQARAERDELMALYKNALGMLAETPLGQAAMEKV